MRKELEFVKGSGMPAILMVSGLETQETEIITGDWFGAYDLDSMLCVGAMPVSYQGTLYANVWGDDTTTPEKENLEFREAFGLFYYDAQSDQFFDLTGDVVNMTGQASELVYQGFNVFKITNPVLGESIQLSINEELINPFIDIIADPTVKVSNDLFIDLKTNDLESYSVMLGAGKGVLKPIKRFIQGKYYEYMYTPVEDDKFVSIIAEGFGKFDGTHVTDQQTVEVIHPKPEQPANTISPVIFENEDFKLITKEKIYGGNPTKIVYAETDLPVRIVFSYVRRGRKTSYTIWGDKGNYRGPSMKDASDLVLKYYIKDGIRYYINQPLEI